MKRFLARQLAWAFASVALLGCNLILDNDEPFLDREKEEPIDATSDAPTGTKSPDGGGGAPNADGAMGDARMTDVPADRDAVGMADDAVPRTDAPWRDGSDVSTPPTDVSTPPTDVSTPPTDVSTPPTDVSTPPADVSTPPTDVPLDKATPPDVPLDKAMPPDVPLDKATPTDAGRDADSGGPPDSRDANVPPDVEEAGPVDVMPPKVDADGCTLNPCGGCAELASTPGAPCGACGTYACNADKDSVNCNNDPGLNACGGCGVLAGAPGIKCGACGTFVCSDNKTSVNCNNDPGLNACGGCGVLAGAPGAKCATCGAYACSTDKSSVICDSHDPLTVKQVAANDGFTCALLTTGGVRCWGRNDDGRLGDGTTVSPRPSPPPVDIVSDVSDITSITVGGNYGCALRSGGNVRCWGDNSLGQLGTGTTTPILNLSGPDILSGVKDVTATSTAACALLNTGAVHCWGGDNSLGELGDGTTTPRSTPNVPVVGLTAVAVSGTCALPGTGGMVCWGGNGGGTLGDGTGVNSAVPVNVLGLSNVSAMGAGAPHTCAIDSGGGVFCWGFNAYGQCGEGRQTRLVYQPPSMNVQTNAKTVGVGATHTCALLNTGRVRCWGENSTGAVGDGTTSQRLQPVDVADLSGVASLAVGASHNCALLNTGEIRCWGANWWGELGDGTSDNIRMTPGVGLWICP